MTDNTIFRSTAFSRVAAGSLAIAMTFATVSAAKAETNEAFRATVEAGIDSELRLPKGAIDKRHGTAVVAVTVGAEGSVQNAAIVHSAGYASFDREALRTARVVSYPATGEVRAVAMVLGFNQPADAKVQGKAARLVAAYAEKQKVMLANRTTAQQPDS